MLEILQLPSGTPTDVVVFLRSDTNDPTLQVRHVPQADVFVSIGDAVDVKAGS